MGKVNFGSEREELAWKGGSKRHLSKQGFPFKSNKFIINAALYTYSKSLRACSCAFENQIGGVFDHEKCFNLSCTFNFLVRSWWARFSKASVTFRARIEAKI